MKKDLGDAFLAVGVTPVSEWPADLHLVQEDGYVDAGEDCRANIPGAVCLNGEPMG